MTVVLPFLLRRGDPVKTEDRNETPKPRSIIIPTWLWEKLDKDAERCGRSATKQLEMFLTLCFDPNADVEIHRETVAEAYKTVSPRRLKKTG